MGVRAFEVSKMGFCLAFCDEVQPGKPVGGTVRHSATNSLGLGHLGVGRGGMTWQQWQEHMTVQKAIRWQREECAKDGMTMIMVGD